jgi:hypothetical protein
VLFASSFRQRAALLPDLLASAAVVMVTACQLSTAPDCPLAGTWAWEWNNNPSGSQLTLVLATADRAVTGTGLGRGVGPNAVDDSIQVVGTYEARAGLFGLTLSYHSGRVVSYAGSLKCPNRLEGSATDGGAPYDLTFYRGTNPLPGPSN